MTLRLFAFLGVLAFSIAAQTPASTAPARRTVKDIDAKEIKLGEDEPGCKDNALLPRIIGCSIIQCDSKETDTVEIQVGVSTDGAVQKESMDGATEVTYYLCPARLTLPHIVKTSDLGLTKAGFKTVYNGKDDDDQPIVTGFKDTEWFQISTYMYNEYSAYIVSHVKVNPESQATSDALAEEMNKNGRVTLSGLEFEKEKFDVPQDAEKLLAEVAALLVRQPDWKIRVEAHGAEGQDRQANIALCQKRASAVAAWLLDHGIDKSRLSIQGISEGASQRIELVRF